MALFESGERNATLIGRDGTERGVIGVMRFDQLDEIWNCYPEISYKLLNAIATDAILKLRSSLDAETKKKRKTKTNHPSTSETCDNMEDNRNGRRSSIRKVGSMRRISSVESDKWPQLAKTEIIYRTKMTQMKGKEQEITKIMKAKAL